MIRTQSPPFWPCLIALPCYFFGFSGPWAAGPAQGPAAHAPFHWHFMPRLCFSAPKAGEKACQNSDIVLYLKICINFDFDHLRHFARREYQWKEEGTNSWKRNRF
ncbi:MAG: hypothetical protein MSB08_00110 [Subdoligranulum sp.]|nr:hypothetical protein [Subdoligranulum sp.]